MDNKLFIVEQNNVGLLNFILIQRYQKMQLEGGRMHARKVLGKDNILHNFILIIQFDTFLL